jgi:hypothetical protein
VHCQPATEHHCDLPAMLVVVMTCRMSTCVALRTGPWKGLFIACGFDPRLSLDGRPYQMLAYRLPTEW